MLVQFQDPIMETLFQDPVVEVPIQQGPTAGLQFQALSAEFHLRTPKVELSIVEFQFQEPRTEVQFQFHKTWDRIQSRATQTVSRWAATMG